jgi:hypothetical protein
LDLSNICKSGGSGSALAVTTVTFRGKTPQLVRHGASFAQATDTTLRDRVPPGGRRIVLARSWLGGEVRFGSQQHLQIRRVGIRVSGHDRDFSGKDAGPVRHGASFARATDTTLRDRVPPGGRRIVLARFFRKTSGGHPPSPRLRRDHSRGCTPGWYVDAPSGPRKCVADCLGNRTASCPRAGARGKWAKPFSFRFK